MTPLAEIEFSGPDTSVVQTILTSAARTTSFVACVAGSVVMTGICPPNSANVSARDVTGGGGGALSVGAVTGVFFSGAFFSGFAGMSTVDVAPPCSVCGVSSTIAGCSLGATTTAGWLLSPSINTMKAVMPRTILCKRNMVRDGRIELPPSVWKTDVLPLNQSRAIELYQN